MRLNIFYAGFCLVIAAFLSPWGCERSTLPTPPPPGTTPTTILPSFTSTSTPNNTATSTFTKTPNGATATSTQTPTPSPTSTPNNTSTSTFTKTPSGATATSTQTPSPSPTSSPTITSTPSTYLPAGCSSTTYTTIAISYNLSSTGNCGFPTGSFDPNDYAAINSTDYANGEMCGACLALHDASASSVTVMVVDNCSSCSTAHELDLGPAAWSTLTGGAPTGQANITWNIIPCPLSLMTGDSSGDIEYEWKSGCSSGYDPIQFLDMLFPVNSVSYSTTSGGTYTPLVLGASGVGGAEYWGAASGSLNETTGPFYFDLTGGGQSVTLGPISVGSCGVINATSSQLPGCGPANTPTSTMTPTLTPTLTPVVTPTSTPGASGSITSAQICVSGDDYSIVYIDGTLIGTFPYAGAPGTNDPANPTCMSVPTGLLTGSQVCLAIETQNTAPADNYSVWDLDITYSSGDHSEITSSGSGISNDYTPTGNPSTAPANDGSGNPWYSPSYGGSAFSTSYCSSGVTASTWVSALYNPITGIQLPFISNNCSGDYSTANSTGALFWRQCTSIPAPAALPGPPNFTLAKSQSAPVISGTFLSVTYSIVVCNSGGPVTTGPVTVSDNFLVNNFIGANPFQFGAWGYGDANCPFTMPYYSNPCNEANAPAANGNSIIFPSFGTGCVTLSAAVTNFYWPPDSCGTLVDQASVSYSSNAQFSNSVTLTEICVATPSVTPTPTP